MNDDAFALFCFNGISHKALGRRPLTEQQQKIYNLARVGWNANQIVGRLGITLASVRDGMQKIKHNGYKI